MRVYEPDAGLPLASQFVAAELRVRLYLGCNGRPAQAVVCKPGFGAATGAELANECVPAGELQPALKFLHVRSMPR